MLEIIPAINCDEKDSECVEAKLKKAEEFADWVHLDVGDGVFSFSKTWGSPSAWKLLNRKLKAEVHLMVEHPENVAEDWLHAGAKRIIFHVEAFPKTKKNPEILRSLAAEKIINLAQKYGAEPMIAINPETKLEFFSHHIGRFGAFMVFSQATPGLSGQKFLPSVLPKIRSLREKYPDAKIETDGGMNAESIRLVREAGANIVVTGSFLFGAKNPKELYEKLREI